MNQKRQYAALEIELICFEAEDVITASPEMPINGWETYVADETVS